MYEAAVLGTIVLMVVAAVDYIRRAWIRETTPVPATWILIVVTMALSFWMYWHSPRKSWTANIGNAAALVNTSAILLGVIAANIRYGTLRVAFDRVQKWCLAGGAGVVMFCVQMALAPDGAAFAQGRCPKFATSVVPPPAP